MKQKILLVLIGVLTAAVMVGCGSKEQTTQAAYISADNARTVALAAAGVNLSDADVTETQLSEKNGIAYYEVEFTAADVKYSYAVDAMTGVIIDVEDDRPEPQDRGEDEVTDYDTTQTAPENTPADGTGEVTDFDTNAPVVGTIPTKDSGTQVTAPPPAVPAADAPGTTSKENGEITLEDAKKIALDHAGKTAAEATFVKAKKDFDDGRSVYEIEFTVVSGSSIQEYDYDISAATGEILGHDRDAESCAPQEQSSAAKTEDEVRQIALAKVPGAAAKDCKLKLDRDDGRLIYEGKITYDGMEYEFEIDAYSGTILDWEAESMYD